MIFEILSFSLPKDVMIGRFQLAIGFGETCRSVLTNVMKFSFSRLVFPAKVCAAFFTRVGDFASRTASSVRILDDKKKANQSLQRNAYDCPFSAFPSSPVRRC